MKTHLVLLILALLIVPVYAQENVSAIELERCQSVETPFEIDTLCETLMNCRLDSSSRNCNTELMVIIFEQCNQLGMNHCAERAFLYETALSPADLYHMETVESLQEMSIHLNENNFVGVVEMFQSVIETDSFGGHYTARRGLGIAFSLIEDYELAIEELSASIAIQYNNPGAYYFRSLAHQRIGNTVQAARDYQTFQAQASSEIIAILPELNLTFEIEQTEQWVVYPVRLYGFAVGGLELQDHTLQDASSVSLSYLDDTTTLAISGLPGQGDGYLFFSLVPEQQNHYLLHQNVQQFPGTLSSGSWSYTIIVDDGYFILESRFDGGEGYFITEDIILPADAPDPRNDLGNRICDGLPLSFVSIGDTVVPGRITFLEFPHREPNSNTEYIQFDRWASILVIDGPVCTESYIWWEVQFEDHSEGWIPENYQNRYNLFVLGSFTPDDKPEKSIEELLNFITGS